MTGLPATSDLAILPHPLVSTGYSYLLIVAAEFGDKSQLVCMTLAARYRAAPVFLGAVVAFLLLNMVAVFLGASFANWVPSWIVSAIAGVLFIGFGLHFLLFEADPQPNDEPTKNRLRSAFLTTFTFIVVSELGDKTQLAVLGLATTEFWVVILIGATLALITTTALAVWVGRDLLTKLPMHRLHQFSGLLFLGFGLFACFRTIQNYS